MRSKLFVPGSRPELFSKALATAADAISLDLEDAVVEARKPEARAAVSDWLRTAAPAASGKIIIVRVNSIDSVHFEADVQAVALAGVHVINLPKPESPDAVRAASKAIGLAERANGVRRPIGMLLNIESPKALRMAATLATADPRVVGLQMGLADLFEPLGISRGELSAIQQAMFAVRLAAGEAGIYACDSVFADINDVAGFRAEAALARRLGFIGKSCIHPKQVALANEAFRPSDAEISHALRVLAAAREAQVQGLGAYLVDGKMIDGPFLARARAIIAIAGELGLLVAQTEDQSADQ